MSIGSVWKGLRSVLRCLGSVFVHVKTMISLHTFVKIIDFAGTLFKSKDCDVYAYRAILSSALEACGSVLNVLGPPWRRPGGDLETS